MRLSQYFGDILGQWLVELYNLCKSWEGTLKKERRLKDCNQFLNALTSSHDRASWRQTFMHTQKNRSQVLGIGQLQSHNRNVGMPTLCLPRNVYFKIIHLSFWSWKTSSHGFVAEWFILMFVLSRVAARKGGNFMKFLTPIPCSLFWLLHSLGAHGEIEFWHSNRFMHF